MARNQQTDSGDKRHKNEGKEQENQRQRVFGALCLMPSLRARHLPSTPGACLAFCLAFTGG